MAVTAPDLLSPKGPIDSKLFPGLESRDLTTRLNGYIAVAVQDINVVAADPAIKDRMTTALSLFYAFRDIVVRMANEPARLEVSESGAHTYNAQQLETMKEIRDQYWLEYSNLIVPVVEDTKSALPGTRTTRTRQVW